MLHLLIVGVVSAVLASLALRHHVAAMPEPWDAKDAPARGIQMFIVAVAACITTVLVVTLFQ